MPRRPPVKRKLKPRTDNTILADAMAMIGRPVEDKDCCDLISSCLTSMRQYHATTAGTPAPAETKAILREHVRVLREARRALVATGSPTDFLASFDGQLLVASSMAELFQVPRGSPRPDMTGVVAAGLARRVLRHHGVPATKTEGGAWYQLTSLLYEAATGISEADLSKYCREADRPPLTLAGRKPTV